MVGVRVCNGGCLRWLLSTREQGAFPKRGAQLAAERPQLTNPVGPSSCCALAEHPGDSQLTWWSRHSTARLAVVRDDAGGAMRDQIGGKGCTQPRRRDVSKPFQSVAGRRLRRPLSGWQKLETTIKHGRWGRWGQLYTSDKKRQKERETQMIETDASPTDERLSQLCLDRPESVPATAAEPSYKCRWDAI